MCSYECAMTSHQVADLLAQPYPSFNPMHEYVVVLDLGNGTPEKLNFGMADCGCFNNSGSHTISIAPCMP